MKTVERTAKIGLEECCQRSRAALRAVEHLFAEDFMAEAALLASNNIDSLLAALSIQAAPGGSESTSPEYAGLPPGGLDRLRQVGMELKQTVVCGSGVSQIERAALLTAAVTESRRVLSLLGKDTGRESGRRLLWTIVATASLVILAASVWRSPATSPQVFASGSFAKEYGAEQAVDGSAFTEWLLPDAQLGWIDIEFSRPRSVRRVMIQNSKNRPFLDRATKDFELVAYWGDEVRFTKPGSFEAITAVNDVQTVQLGDIEITHIRISVLSYYGAGGGLAEVTIK
jgi:hypothetical protein